MTTTPEKKLVEPDAAGLFWEARVSEALNVPRKTLAKLRQDHLTEGSDFRRIANNAVALTRAGLERVEHLLTTAGQETGGKPPSDDVPAGPPQREIMTVERLPQNTGLLLCISKPRAILVVVRVRENTNFKPGMQLEAVQSHDGVWQFRNRAPGDESTVGRLPRGVGRW